MTKLTRIKRPRGQLPAGSAPATTLVNAQKALRLTVPQSSHYGDDPAIKTTFDLWTSVTDKYETVRLNLAQNHAQGVTLAGEALELHAEYFACGDLFMSTLGRVFLGNQAAFQTFAVPAVAPRGPAPLTTTPLDLRANPRKGQPNHNLVRWHGERAAGIYELERCSDPPVEASYALVYSGKRASFVDAGTAGQVAWYRIRAKGNETSAWSSPISYVFR